MDRIVFLGKVALDMASQWLIRYANAADSFVYNVHEMKDSSQRIEAWWSQLKRLTIEWWLHLFKVSTCSVSYIVVRCLCDVLWNRTYCKLHIIMIANFPGHG